MAEITLDGKRVAEDTDTYLIAECGHNHMGDVDIALDMVDAAYHAGADCVKFQRIHAKRLFTEYAYNEPYSSENAFAPEYGRHREALTLSDDGFKRVFDRCNELGITFACTPFEEWSATFLNELGCKVFKMASFHMNDHALIDYVRSFGHPMIISTGNASLYDIDTLTKHMFGYEYALLHCTSEYPIHDPTHINLKGLQSLNTGYSNSVWGYSHHYGSPYPAAVSYFFGARIVEVHFTLDRSMKGTDQAFSLEPDGLRWLSNQLKLNRRIAGDGNILPFPEESAPIRKMSRSIRAAHDINIGDTIDSYELSAPGDGLPSSMWPSIEGKRAKKQIKQGEIITRGDYEYISS